MNKHLYNFSIFLHYNLSRSKRYKLWVLTRRGSAALREIGDKIKRGGLPHYIGPPETDYDFIMRLAHRPSWYYHRPRLLRIAKVVWDKEEGLHGKR